MKISNLVVLVSLCSLTSAGCNTADPTNAVLSNQYPSANDSNLADSMAVYKGWWSVALFPDPVPAGQTSDPIRIVQGTDYGYALLAPGWDASAGGPPTTLIPLRSAQKLGVDRGGLLTFVVSEQATVGDCRAGHALLQDEADFITQRIFPGEFAGLVYDAATCMSSPATTGEGK